MRTKIFCSFCAGRLEREFLEGKEQQVCKKCDDAYYENPVLAVSVILPSKDMWCLPVGFAESRTLSHSTLTAAHR